MRWRWVLKILSNIGIENPTPFLFGGLVENGILSGSGDPYKSSVVPFFED